MAEFWQRITYCRSCFRRVTSHLHLVQFLAQRVLSVDWLEIGCSILAHFATECLLKFSAPFRSWLERWIVFLSGDFKYGVRSSPGPTPSRIARGSARITEAESLSKQYWRRSFNILKSSIVFTAQCIELKSERMYIYNEGIDCPNVGTCPCACAYASWISKTRDVLSPKQCRPKFPYIKKRVS